MKRRFKVKVDGETFIVEVEEMDSSPAGEAPSAADRPVAEAPRRVERIHRTGAGGIITAPLPGVVSEIRVGAGDHVEAGAVLLVLEAMKMENEVYAPVSGLVKEVYVKAGQQVARGERLILLS